MRIKYFIHIALLSGLVLVSCNSPIPPHAYAGRYYGMDSIYSIDKLYQDTFSQTTDIFLDVVDLGNGHFDISNSTGYWVREGELLENKININVLPFTGKVKFFQDSIVLTSEANEDNYFVKHTSTLTR